MGPPSPRSHLLQIMLVLFWGPREEGGIRSPRDHRPPETNHVSTQRGPGGHLEQPAKKALTVCAWGHSTQPTGRGQRRGLHSAARSRAEGVAARGQHRPVRRPQMCAECCQTPQVLKKICKCTSLGEISDFHTSQLMVLKTAMDQHHEPSGHAGRQLAASTPPPLGSHLSSMSPPPPAHLRLPPQPGGETSHQSLWP